jgi:hypothetical protein
MSLELMLYLVDILGSLNVLLFISIVVIFSIFLFIFFQFNPYNNEEESFKYIKFYVKRFGIILTVLLPIFILTPSTKTLHLIIGTNYLKESNIPAKVLKVLNNKLDQYIKEDKKNEENL